MRLKARKDQRSQDRRPTPRTPLLRPETLISEATSTMRRKTRRSLTITTSITKTEIPDPKRSSPAVRRKDRNTNANHLAASNIPNESHQYQQRRATQNTHQGSHHPIHPLIFTPPGRLRMRDRTPRVSFSSISPTTGTLKGNGHAKEERPRRPRAVYVAGQWPFP